MRNKKAGFMKGIVTVIAILLLIVSLGLGGCAMMAFGSLALGNFGLIGYVLAMAVPIILMVLILKKIFTNKGTEHQEVLS